MDHCVWSNNTVRAGICLYNFELHSTHPTPDKKNISFTDGPISFQEVRGSEGSVAVFMPQRVLMKHRGDAVASGGTGDVWRERFNEEVLRSSVSLHATMPMGRMTLGQLASLEPGQVIELEAGAQVDARLSAKDKTLFVCEFGKLGQNYTVRIRHPFDAGQDFIDGLLQV